MPGVLRFVAHPGHRHEGERMSEALPKGRQGPHTVRLRLECRCGKAQTLYVHPDAPAMSVAKAHGWRFVLTDWACPKCLKEP